MHHPLFLIGSFGTTEMLLILFVVILLFGAKRIPELFRGMGQGVREFKDASTRPDDQQPQYRDQPMAPPVQPPYPPQGYPQQGYPQQPYPQQPGYPQPGAPQPGYQQPAPPAYNPNDPNSQPRQQAQYSILVMQPPLFLMFGDIGGSEVILIMVVILIFFGANKIPELARGLGKGIREFKDASTEIRREFEQAGQPAPPTNYQQQPGAYAPTPQYHATPLPTADAEPGSGFDPWATPAYVAPTPAPDHKTEEPAPPAALALPPNLAPEGTQPRQPYIPADASPDA